MAHRLRILHISDLHERVALDWMKPERKAKVRNGAAGRYRVFEEFKKILPQLNPIDIVCFSGDAADWGLAEEYKLVTPRITEVLRVLDVPAERLFLIPGNHDINRNEAKTAWQKLRELAGINLEGLSRWMGGENAPYGAEASWREEIAGRTAAFWQWVQEDLSRPQLNPSQGPHERLGYRVEVSGLKIPFPVQIIGLDSAWLCGDDGDAGKLALTKAQIDRLTTNDQGQPLPGFRLAMVHHPLKDLLDDNDSRKLLTPDRIDVLLHGHQHEPIAKEFKNPDHSLLELAAGSLYEGDQGDTWKNGFHVVEVELNDQGRPVRYNLEFWGWSPNGFWHLDSAIYRNAPNGKVSIPTALGKTQPSAPPLPLERKTVFVGREGELETLKSILLDQHSPSKAAVVCNVQGMAGVGKSWLVEHFAAEHRELFPGGMLALVLEANANLSADDLLGRLADQLKMTGGNEPLKVRLVEVLKAVRPLVHLENVDDAGLARAAAEFARKLAGVPLVITGRFAGFQNSPQWKTIPIRSFDIETGVDQLAGELSEEARRRIDKSARERLVGVLGGLPLAIHLAAGYLNSGYTVDNFLKYLQSKGLSLEPIYVNDTNYAHRTTQALSATFEISLMLLERHLTDTRLMPGVYAFGMAPRAGFGLNLGAAITNLDEPKANWVLVEANRLSLLERVENRKDVAWRVHPLLAEYLRNKLDEANKQAVAERLSGWFLQQMPSGEEQGQRWKLLSAEREGLVQWLGSLSAQKAAEAASWGFDFAQTNGPYRAWMEAADKFLEEVGGEFQSRLLWVKGKLAIGLGELDRAVQSAEKKEALGLRSGDERDVAVARGLSAEILKTRGHLDEALKILQEQVLPVFEKLEDIRETTATRETIADIFQARGEWDKALKLYEENLLVDKERKDIRSVAVTHGKIAYILQLKGQLDKALKILEKQVLPVYETLGDIRSAASAKWKIADIFRDKGQLDKALHVLKEQTLSVFEGLEDVRSVALTQVKIADILQDRGQLDEALKIRLEQLPVFEKIGDARELIVARTNTATNLWARGKPGDKDEAVHLLRLAFDTACQMQLPEANQIAEILRRFGENP